MKREIKFRAWNKDMKEMVLVSAIQFDSHSPIENPNITDKYNDILPLEDVVLMQYTGLKDRNGKEIYEGDIISKKWLVEVYQSEDGCWMLRFYNNPTINKPMSLLEYLKLRKNAGTGDTDNVVIGNVFENPELLK